MPPVKRKSKGGASPADAKQPKLTEAPHIAKMTEWFLGCMKSAFWLTRCLLPFCDEFTEASTDSRAQGRARQVPDQLLRHTGRCK